MSRAVMLSIRPKWCVEIANGRKTIEVRKTRPKIEPPFKCYIYCTKNGEAIWGKNYERHGYLNGKVIGEFVCDAILPIWFKCSCDPAVMTTHYEIPGTRLPDVKFTAARSKYDNCLCTACHGDGFVTMIGYPITLYYDGKNLTTHSYDLWLCDECLEKMLAAIRETRRVPVDTEPSKCDWWGCRMEDAAVQQKEWCAGNGWFCETCIHNVRRGELHERV